MENPDKYPLLEYHNRIKLIKNLGNKKPHCFRTSKKFQASINPTIPKITKTDLKVEKDYKIYKS